MHGPDIGSLIVYTVKPDQTRTELQRITGEQGDLWKRWDLDINVSLGSREYLRIIIEATVGVSFQGKRCKA